MDIGRNGDMGFAEAILAFMAVTVVLTAFLGLVAHGHPSLGDPTGTLDESAFTGSVEDGTFVPSYSDKLGDILDTGGFSGICVSVSVPGGFCEVPPPLTEGDMDGRTYTRTFASVISDDNGRSFPAFFEVTVCV